MSNNVFVKDPDSLLDYRFAWTEWLEEISDTIDSVAWVVPTGVTNEADSATTTTATVWVSGGTLNQSYTVTCRITTVGGRTDDRSLILKIREK